jgi:hypothetical protein
LVLLEGSAEAMCRFVEVARGRGDAQTLATETTNSTRHHSHRGSRSADSILLAYPASATALISAA